MSNRHRTARALDVAIDCLTTRFAGACFAFASGSIIRGEGNDYSDIDLVVVFPNLPRAWRESFEISGFPVEAFVHDSQTLRYFMDNDIQSGCPIIVNMVATGIIIGNEDIAAGAMQREAQRLLALGPKPLSDSAYDRMRYVISDIADDLRADRPAAEVAGLAAMLYPQLVDLMLIGRGAWSGRGKWAARLLARFDQGLADALNSAFAKAASGDASELTALAESELERHGGRFFNGYRQEAAPQARRIEPLN
ncbi:nucleotidyltransferase domain-containing protein [Rhizobium sp. CNPSo 3968]|uniref:nucleotidyltransferase domain-containing protein n=1 Tax=Rhizobium sp. CNPSo 3968 TaxID=3021408 RepID=UPI00254B1428|nr:nucleotidyltransferase domain-containing protein [Rhizobium sp. CNPSo 3968]MDK4717775.1 nucleotidyltransferase domain-containing protein [Rhizobium sp. CNPSo 3968]